MFDWARGSMLKQLVERKLFFSEWKRDDWLMNWHTPWLLGLIEFTPGMSVLDVGSSAPHLMLHLRETYGCDVHALDAQAADANKANFGFQGDTAERFPGVELHVGFAGDDLLPAEKFDLVTCISALEHTYDHATPLQAERPMPHLHALRDMARMLKPGGVLLMNWDLYLDNMPQKFGYDFEMDFQYLRASGLRLVTNRRRLRSTPYLFCHPETLWFDPYQVLGFKLGALRRGTAINMLWRKPGTVSRVRLAPRPGLEGFYFPDDETRLEPDVPGSPEPPTEEIDKRFRQLIAFLTDVLGRTDVDGPTIEAPA